MKTKVSHTGNETNQTVDQNANYSQSNLHFFLLF